MNLAIVAGDIQVCDENNYILLSKVSELSTIPSTAIPTPKQCVLVDDAWVTTMNARIANINGCTDSNHGVVLLKFYAQLALFNKQQSELINKILADLQIKKTNDVDLRTKFRFLNTDLSAKYNLAMDQLDKDLQNPTSGLL